MPQSKVLTWARGPLLVKSRVISKGFSDGAWRGLGGAWAARGVVQKAVDKFVDEAPLGGASRARNPGVNVARVVLAASVPRPGGLLGCAAARQLVPKLGRRHHPNREPTVTALQRMAVGTSKRAFTLHGDDAPDRPVLRRDLDRGQMARFFANPPPTEVVLEACAGSHHWGAATAADSGYGKLG